MSLPLSLTAVLLLAFARAAPAHYSGWKHSGSVHVITTPEGADPPATASVEHVPLFVRLGKKYFDFTEAKAGGDD